jgi:hypothetical protein
MLLRSFEKPLASSGLAAASWFSTATTDHSRSARMTPEEGAKMDAAIIASVCASPRVMRAMPRLLQKSDLKLEASMSYVLAEVGRADYWAGMLNSLPVLLPKAGLVDRDTAEAFVVTQRQASEDGTFFCAENFYAYIARPPA